MDIDKQNNQFLSAFAYRLASFSSDLKISLDALEIRHPGVKAFLSSNISTHDSLCIRQIRVNSSASSIYVVENLQNVRLVLKVLSREACHADQVLTEKALTKVSADIFVSPQCLTLDKNFILLSYISRGSGFFDTAPVLVSEQSFVKVLERLRLLHGASIIPQKQAITVDTNLNSFASKQLNIERLTLDAKDLVERLKTLYSTSVIVPSTRSVFIHANIHPLNIVEDSIDTYLIDWKHAGQGNPYVDLGAVFAMYSLEDELKLRLIREHYPNTTMNKLPEEDGVLLKELNLFAAIYWFNIALSFMNTTVLHREQCLFLPKTQQINNNIFQTLEPNVLINSALCEAQLRVNRIENLNCRNKCTF